MDFNRDFSRPPDQERWFAEQLELVSELGLSVFLHEEDAHAGSSGACRNTGRTRRPGSFIAPPGPQPN